MALADRVVTTSALSNTTPWNITHVVTAGTNRGIAVAIYGYQAAGTDVTGITYAGVALTKNGESTASSNSDVVEIWGLANPASGSNTLAITFAAGPTYDCGAMVISATGVDQTTPLGTFASQVTPSGTAKTVTVTSATDRWVIDGIGYDNAAGGALTMTADAGRTEDQNALQGGERVGASDDTSSAASEVMDWTTASSVPAALGATSIVAAAGGGGGSIAQTTVRTLTGAGV